MSQILKYFLPITVILGIVLIQNACVHDLSMGVEIDPDPIDSVGNPTDTIVNDTTNMDTTNNTIPCDTSKVYFEKDILPILNNNCAISGCHDADSASDGIILTSYEQVINSDVIVPMDLSDSDLYEALIDDDVEDVMPPSGRLDNKLILIIAQWILQGADNLECDDDLIPCGIESVNYSIFISDLMVSNCNGCHGTNVASGGIVTDNYTSVKALVESGQFYGSLAWQSGFARMPQNLDQLDSCNLANIKIWIDEGAQNN